MSDLLLGGLALLGPRLACQEAARLLASGQSLVVLVGPWFDPVLVADGICSGTALRDLGRVVVRACASRPPEDQLAVALGCDVPSLLLGEPIDCNSWKVVVLDELDGISDADLAGWFSLAEKWAKQAQGGRSSGRPLPPLLLCLRGRRQVPPPGAHLLLATIAFHRTMSELDMRYLVRLRSGHEVTSAAALWREHVLPSLVGPDPHFLDALWQACLEGEAALLEACRGYASHRGWSGTEAPDEFCGTCVWGARSEAQHHLAFAVVQGDTHALARRCWRGQSTLVLPMIDELRLWLCERLNDRLERGWALRWSSPSSLEEQVLVEEDWRHCQLGHLCRILKFAPLRGDEQRDLLTLATRLKSARNELAHYRPISFDEFFDLFESVQGVKPW